MPGRLVLACGLLLAAVVVARPASQGTAPSAYTIHTAEGRRQLPFRTAGGAEMVSLDQLATIFNLSLAEDALVGGLTVRGKGQTILLIPGQSFASIGPGNIRSLSAPVQRDRNAWQVPVDFIREALAPALGVRIEIRRPSRLILVGDVRVPQITWKLERQGAMGRIVVDIRPPAPYKIARDGRRVTIRFDAVALDATPFTGLAAELVTAARIDGTSLIVDLGASVDNIRSDDGTDGRLQIELLPPPPPTPVAPPAAAVPPPAATAPAPVRDPPVIDMGGAGTVRTVVIDPGHGGDDTGARGASGAVEKDLVLQMARRLKATIESRMGLRVLLTRDGDETVPIDRRTALANNNKADLFISLHANASVRPATRGVQVLSLSLQDYEKRSEASKTAELPVPVIGGGFRAIDIVPWNLAQLPFANRSATLGAILVRQLAERNVTLFPRPAAQMPLRVLVGANMPAVLVEMGFLTNAEDESKLTNATTAATVIEAIVATITEVRRGVPGDAPGRGRGDDRHE